VNKIPAMTVLVLLLLLIATGDLAASQCSVATTPLSFGGYDPLSSTATATTASIAITCQTPERFPQQVTLQLSAGASGTPAQRTMTSVGGNVLLYNIYLDAGMAQVLGDGTAGSTTPSRQVSRNTPWNLTLYGRIPPLQNLPAGAYSDTLTATILW